MQTSDLTEATLLISRGFRLRGIKVKDGGFWIFYFDHADSHQLNYTDYPFKPNIFEAVKLLIEEMIFPDLSTTDEHDINAHFLDWEGENV